MPRRNPFDDIDRIFDRLNRQLEDASSVWESNQGVGLAGADFAVDVEDAPEEFVVTVDLPGFDKTDVDVRVKDRTLTVSAERSEEHDTGDEESTYIRHERRSRSFSRSITLPEPVDESDVSATMTNGVLTVRLGKTDESSGHRIDVE